MPNYLGWHDHGEV
jgi:hypothetical protein